MPVVMTPAQKAQIDAMTQTEMASLWRFAPIGHPFFNNENEASDYFAERFKELGGMTPAISKDIGWDR